MQTCNETHFLQDTDEINRNYDYIYSISRIFARKFIAKDQIKTVFGIHTITCTTVHCRILIIFFINT